jgi:hypothetical protein
MILPFPNLQERRRAGKQKRFALAKPHFRSVPSHAALVACRAELQAIAHSATLLTRNATVPVKEKPRQGGTWGPGLEPRMGRAEARTVAAKASAYMANSLCL